MNRIILIVLAAAALVCLAAAGASTLQRRAAQAYDDPAVAVCEFTKLRGRHVTPAQYSRQSATVEGRTVTIVYSSSPLNTRPTTHSYSCEFTTDDSGAFVLDSNDFGGSSECQEKIADLRKEIESGVSPERLEEAQRIFDSCRTLMEQEIDAALDNLEAIQVPLVNSGIYPIQPKDTSLRP